MRRLCPSTTELQAFEAAARHLSFTRAATELHVTQGAVSRLIRHLEDRLGIELFERVRRRIVLTEAGTIYLAKVRPSLNQLEAATLELMAHHQGGGTLSLATLPTLGATWLIPRLPSFYRAHPSIRLNFVPHPVAQHFPSPQMDAAILFGEGVWPNAVADYIIGKEVVPICHPNLLAGKNRIKSAPDLLRHTLLQHSSVPRGWQDWFDSLGFEEVNGMVGPRFDQFSVIVQAVIAGLGVAIVPRCLVQDEIQSCRVAVPVDAVIESKQGYFLAYSEEKSRLPTLAAFRTWVLEEARRT